MGGQIFISYRHDDAAYAGRLYDHLAQKFPTSRIFMDIDNVDPGVIKTSVESCQVLIAVIGRNWLDARDADGNRRLDNPADFVRLEIATALQRYIKVIPVLLESASMPQTGQLPHDLELLVLSKA